MKLSFCLLFIFSVVVRPLLFVRRDSLAVKSNTSVNWRVIGRDNLLLGKHVQIFVCVVVDKMVIIRPNKFSFPVTNQLLLNVGLHNIRVITSHHRCLKPHFKMENILNEKNACGASLLLHLKN